MAVTVTEYAKFKQYVLDALDWDTTILKLALLAPAHVPDYVNDLQFSHVVGDEVSGTGYTTGGKTINITSIADGEVLADLVTWTGLDTTVRYVVCYASGISLDGNVDPVLFLYDLGADVVVGGVDWSFSWASNMVYRIY